MFLGMIKDHDCFFLTLATLVAFASKETKEETDFIEHAMDFISDSEMDKLIFISNQLGMEINESDRYDKYHKILDYIGAFYSSMFTAMSIYVPHVLCPVLWVELGYNTKNPKPDSMKSNPEFILEIIEKSVSDIIEIYANGKEGTYLERKNFSTKSKEGTPISIKQKKAMIFELLGMAYTDGVFNNREQRIIYKISDLLSLERESVNEFENLVLKIIETHKETLELINE
jgi:hypothetical protein